MDPHCLTTSPKHYPDCCLSLSTQLIAILTEVIGDLVEHGIVLSIGSGSGLLERHLLDRWTGGGGSAAIEGVEISSASSPSVNIYLPEEAISQVIGTWELSPRVDDASVLMFVYPREPKLVSKYVELIVRQSSGVRLILWLGPKVDWEDFAPCFRGCAKLGNAVVVDNSGLVEYEMLATVKVSSLKPT